MEKLHSCEKTYLSAIVALVKQLGQFRFNSLGNLLNGFRGCLRSVTPAQSPDHEMDHGGVNHCFAGFGQILVILA